MKHLSQLKNKFILSVDFVCLLVFSKQELLEIEKLKAQKYELLKKLKVNHFETNNAMLANNQMTTTTSNNNHTTTTNNPNIVPNNSNNIRQNQNHENKENNQPQVYNNAKSPHFSNFLFEQTTAQNVTSWSIEKPDARGKKCEEVELSENSVILFYVKNYKTYAVICD